MSNFKKIFDDAVIKLELETTGNSIDNKSIILAVNHYYYPEYTGAADDVICAIMEKRLVPHSAYRGVDPCVMAGEVITLAKLLTSVIK